MPTSTRAMLDAVSQTVFLSIVELNKLSVSFEQV